MKRVVETEDAPAAVGAYSQATVADGLVFTAGQIPLTSEGDLLADEPIAVQTRQAMENVAAIVEEAGGDLGDLLKVTVYLEDIENFDAMNEAYADFFDDEPPARSAVEVASLPKGVGIEIEAVASVE